MLAKDAMKDVQLSQKLHIIKLKHAHNTIDRTPRGTLAIKLKQRIFNAWETSYIRRLQLLDNFWMTKFSNPEKPRRNFAVRLDGSSFMESNNSFKYLL